MRKLSAVSPQDLANSLGSIPSLARKRFGHLNPQFGGQKNAMFTGENPYIPYVLQAP
jgi:hypothetical protein